MRTVVPVALVGWVFLYLLIVPVGTVQGAIKPKTLAKVWQGACAVAIGQTGAVHTVYQGADYHLHHARFDGRRWQHELVDAISDCGWGNSLAIDAQGRLHASYFAYRGLGYPKIVYARHDGTQWHITDLGVDGSDTVIRLDQAGRPRILFAGPADLQMARWTGSAWEFESTGLAGGPYRHDFVLDAENHAHVVYSRNYDGLYYATDASGSWVSTFLESGNSTPAAIGLDAEQHPCVAAAVPGTVRWYREDNDLWSSEDMLDPALTMSAPVDGVALAMGANGQPHVMIGASIQGMVEVSIYAFHDGVQWSGALVDSKNAGFYPSVAVDAAGAVWATYCTAQKNNKASAKWVNIELPDWAGSWQNVQVTPDDGGWMVTGTLTVTNVGPVKTVKTGVWLFVSDDAELDEEDEMLPVEMKLKALNPGAAATLAVGFRYTTPLAGKYLLAVIDPEWNGPDRNWLDNVVPVVLGP